MAGKEHHFQDKLDAIFKALHRGKKAHEIDDLLNPHPNSPTLKDWFVGINKRGIESLTNVYHSIIRLPSVEEINFVSANSERDSEGFNMDVHLRRGFFSHLRNVGVQVKSSLRNIYEFENRMQRRLGLSWADLRRWFLGQRLVVLNGQEKDDKISDDFLAQVRDIQTFHDPESRK